MQSPQHRDRPWPTSWRVFPLGQIRTRVISAVRGGVGQWCVGVVQVRAGSIVAEEVRESVATVWAEKGHLERSAESNRTDWSVASRRVQIEPFAMDSGVSTRRGCAVHCGNGRPDLTWLTSVRERPNMRFPNRNVSAPSHFSKAIASLRNKAHSVSPSPKAKEAAGLTGASICLYSSNAPRDSSLAN